MDVYAATNGVFVELASETFEFLVVDYGLTRSVRHECKAVSFVDYAGPEFTVRFCYDPFGPPACWVVSAESDETLFQASPSVSDPAAAELARPTTGFRPELLALHQAAMAEWFRQARPLVEAWMGDWSRRDDAGSGGRDGA
jgi:hypothetical protein